MANAFTPFLSRKFIVTVIALATLVVIGIMWATQKMIDKGLWALWFGAVNVVLGIYGSTNVAAKKKV